MPLDAVCLSGVVRELRETILGLRVEKIQQPARDQIILTLRGNKKLLMCAGASQSRLHRSEEHTLNSSHSGESGFAGSS